MVFTPQVAPYLGAWIEILINGEQEKYLWVAPYLGAWIEIIKQNRRRDEKIIVAPYLGAWIEIETEMEISKWERVAPYLGAWIEIAIIYPNKLTYSRRSLLGSVDWNTSAPFDWTISPGRSLLGSVDWNNQVKSENKNGCSRSLLGSVDWNNQVKSENKNGCMSLPTWERGLKFSKCYTCSTPPWVAPYLGAWIEIYGT